MGNMGGCAMQGKHEEGARSSGGALVKKYTERRECRKRDMGCRVGKQQGGAHYRWGKGEQFWGNMRKG